MLLPLWICAPRPETQISGINDLRDANYAVWEQGLAAICCKKCAASQMTWWLRRRIVWGILNERSENRHFCPTFNAFGRCLKATLVSIPTNQRWPSLGTLLPGVGPTLVRVTSLLTSPAVWKAVSKNTCRPNIDRLLYACLLPWEGFVGSWNTQPQACAFLPYIVLGTKCTTVSSSKPTKYTETDGIKTYKNVYTD